MGDGSAGELAELHSSEQKDSRSYIPLETREPPW